MKRYNVLHLIDSLSLGGAERMAVNLVNTLDRNQFRPFLCATRRAGPLKSELLADVEFLCLSKKSTLDISAFIRLANYIRNNNIHLIHAHSSSLFLGSLMAFMLPSQVKLIWHDHFGRSDVEVRNPWLYFFALRNTDAAISVNTKLAQWAREQARAQHVFYIPNFVTPGILQSENLTLPGLLNNRIVCVANFRPEKDHTTLLLAFKTLLETGAHAHLLLIGIVGDESYAVSLKRLIEKLEIELHVSWLGQRSDVPSVLKQCTIGVLSSKSEGLPLSLLEYSNAGLAVVSTDVGQCGELIIDSQTGFLTQPGDYLTLAASLGKLLASDSLRVQLSSNLNRLVNDKYSSESVIAQIQAVYGFVLGESKGAL